jgi:hypothetical protein
MKDCSPCLDDANYSDCCIKVGKAGSKIEGARWYLFILCAALVAVSAILLCVSAIGLSLDGTDKYSWSKGHATHFTPPNVQGDYDNYAGLTGMVTTWRATNTSGKPYAAMENEVHTMAWNAETCTLACCSECETASIASVTLVFLGLLVCIPTLICNCQRATHDSDTNIDKLFGIVGGTLGFLFTLTAILIYHFQCDNNLPSANMFTFKIGGIDVPVTVHFEYQLGIGQICLIIACIFQLIAVIAHIMIQTPEEQWSRPSEEEPLVEKKEEPVEQPRAIVIEEPEEDDKQKSNRELLERIAESKRKLAEAERKGNKAKDYRDAAHDERDAELQKKLSAHEKKVKKEKELAAAEQKGKKDLEERRAAQALKDNAVAPENLPRGPGKGPGKGPSSGNQV